MVLENISNIIEKYNLSNILKVIILLIILYLTYRIFINTDNLYYNDITNLNKDIIEGFSVNKIDNIFGNNIYGNVLSLNDPKNIPLYSLNTCILTLDNIYRIDTIIIIFNALPNNSSSVSDAAQYNGTDPIFIQYQDSTGSMRNLKADNSGNDSPHNFQYNITSMTHLNLTSITDENGLAIYTSKIIITVGSKTNIIDRYIDKNGIGYINNFGIYGGTRDLMSSNDYISLSSGLISTSCALVSNNQLVINPLYDPALNTDKYTFTASQDSLIYALNLDISSKIVNPLTTQDNSNTIQTLFTTTTEPFSITLTYDNSIYPNNDFTISNTYYARSDANKLQTQNTFIYFTQPIIANTITISVKRVLNVINNINTSQSIQLNIMALNIIGKNPLTPDINNYKQTVNASQQTSGSGESSSICPNINQIASTQSKTQLICDNLEYQDKVKTEKLRLERNKQYLLKLQDQQDQVEQLNTVIQELETKRQARATSGDQIRVLQYQQQKADANTIRDLANQRIDSQTNNQLYMDVNIN